MVASVPVTADGTLTTIELVPYIQVSIGSPVISRKLYRTVVTRLSVLITRTTVSMMGALEAREEGLRYPGYPRPLADNGDHKEQLKPRSQYS